MNLFATPPNILVYGEQILLKQPGADTVPDGSHGKKY